MLGFVLAHLEVSLVCVVISLDRGGELQEEDLRSKSRSRHNASPTPLALSSHQ